MRNILALIGAAAIAFVAVGWYLGWYEVSRAPTSSGKQTLQVDINPDKITSDVKKAGEEGSRLVDQLRDKNKGETTAQQSGPATNFFTPTLTEKDKGSSGGWRVIGDK